MKYWFNTVLPLQQKVTEFLFGSYGNTLWSTDRWLHYYESQQSARILLLSKSIYLTPVVTWLQKNILHNQETIWAFSWKDDLDWRYNFLKRAVCKHFSCLSPIHLLFSTDILFNAELKEKLAIKKRLMLFQGQTPPSNGTQQHQFLCTFSPACWF